MMGENLVYKAGDTPDLNREITGPVYTRLILGAFVAARSSGCICPRSEAFRTRDYGESKRATQIGGALSGISPNSPLKSRASC